ncbi:DUF4369 domain-containing protein [Maribacter sp. 2307ULW6-5]|uniref:DUF4369 domain-containing protein n=1 Tax=Maribacter sp. 2307ULW6-5 TaxID=3386275 RepID=UPI0039BD1777
MKKNVLPLLILLILGSCASEKDGDTMYINGNIKGLKKGKLYLQHLRDTLLVTLDSLELKGDGNFSFSTPLESPEVFYLYLDKKDNNDINDRLTFFGERGTIDIRTDWNRFVANAEISGSKTQDKWEEYQRTMSNLNKRGMEIMVQSNQTEVPLTEKEMDSLEMLSIRNMQKGYAFAINFALANRDNHIAPYIALKEIPDANRKYLDSIATSLSPEVARSKYGQELQTYLNQKEED